MKLAGSLLATVAALMLVPSIHAQQNLNLSGVRLWLERREYGQPASLPPQAVLVGVQTQAVAIPRAQGCRVCGAQEVSADPEHPFHAASLP